MEQGEDLAQKCEQEQHSDMAGDGDFNMDKDWTASLLEKRDEKDQDKRRGLGKVEKTSGRKRMENGAADIWRSKKKRKYGTIGEDWGLVDRDMDSMTKFLYSGIGGMTPHGTKLAIEWEHMVNTIPHGEQRRKWEW